LVPGAGRAFPGAALVAAADALLASA